MSRTRRGTLAALVALALALAVPALAAAATKPGVSTGGASKVTITTATLNGKVNPHGAATTYFFQYGTTPAYGSRTPDAARRRRHRGRRAPPRRSPASGPNTKYHYRLVARNGVGTDGRRRSHLHDAQAAARASRWPPRPTPSPSAPPRRSPARSRAPATPGARSACSRSRSRSRAAFTNVGNVQLTNAQGAFSFALLSVPLTTQYRVLVTDKTSVVSPILTVSVSVVVGTKTTRTHVHRGGHVHFSGTIKPNVPNVPVAIQKLNAKKHWVTISGTITREGGTYSKTIRIRRGGSYRVYAGASGGTFAPGAGRKVRIHTT